MEKRSDMPDPKSGESRVADLKMAAAKAPIGCKPSVHDAGALPPANKLTPEEQMALFEKELKENDWGHQPC